MKVLRKLSIFLVRAASSYEYLSVVILILVTGIVLSEITARLFKASVFALVDICAIALLVMTFASVGAIFMKGNHVRMDIILSRIPHKQRQVVELIQGIIAIITTIACAYIWGKMSYSLFKFDSHFANLPIAKWTVEIFVIAGWLVLIIAEIAFTTNKAKGIFGSSRGGSEKSQTP